MTKKIIKKVIIEPGCITCGLCEFIEPEVFQVRDISYVDESIDPEIHAKNVRKAAQECPVSVIKIIEK